MHTQHHRPNIVFILADDLGEWALGCSGNEEVKTPHLDRLAAEGMRFSNFFCTSPVCSPARASILTGHIPSQHGVHDWIRAGNIEAAGLEEGLATLPRFQDESLATSYLAGQTGYTEKLVAAGYTCALSGKWHLGSSLTPQMGFSRWYTIARGGCSYMEPDMVVDGQIKLERHYVTDLITRQALRDMEDLAKERHPFYMSVHYTAPHSPWNREEHPEEYLRLYDSCEFHSVPELPPHPDQSPTCPQGQGEARKELLRGYYASITAMDAGIGQLLEQLTQLGIREQTLVIFMSDNGMNMGHHGVWGKGNGTFPLNMYDTSVKVPALFSHPGRIPAGQICAELVSQYDLYPTILEYAGIHEENSGTEKEPRPGSSFAGILLGSAAGTESGASTHREEVVIYDEYGPVRMLRTADWKYIHRYPYGPHELYDLTHDPGEEHNLIQEPEHQGRIQVFRKRLGEWFQSYLHPERDGVYCAVTGFGQLSRLSAGDREGRGFQDRPSRDEPTS
ncbi:mucin-desulfating sulfatase [Paenibacillus algicola]|uniref:Mucin-desulfating sulfatase n=1 Tax=Paenibacillus algicola TaxID=2565926 RepID=A0A4P8XMS6_9BACL|nr:sulfatase-like hydrolase/transferase [Paenibacillus algicola]QCT01599.1 mucin-desulfating sulfatase [Paenibacillus algicola]